MMKAVAGASISKMSAGPLIAFSARRRLLPVGTDHPFNCPPSCSGCPRTDVGDASPVSTLEGASMAGGAVLAFLLPLILALVGSLILIATPTGQLLGGVTGLALGMLLVRLIAARWKPPRVAKR